MQFQRKLIRNVSNDAQLHWHSVTQLQRWVTFSNRARAHNDADNKCNGCFSKTESKRRNEKSQVH